MVDELFIKNCISHMEDDIERWNSQIESTESDLRCMKKKLNKIQCKIIDTPQDYHGLKAEVNGKLFSLSVLTLEESYIDLYVNGVFTLGITVSEVKYELFDLFKTLGFNIEMSDRLKEKYMEG
ncbi:MAG: hypothetical protein ACRCX8_09995 [Sarcina sp.]